MRNFVKKHMSKTCRPTIQQSKRRQALMAASVQDNDEHDFNTAFSQRNGDVQLDSENEGCSDSGMNDVGTSSISINEGEE